MDPVSTTTDYAAMDSEIGSGAVTDLNTHLGDLQMGGGNDMLIDEYDPVDEKPDVAIVTTDDSTKEIEPEVLANDCIPPRITNALSDAYS